MGSAIDTTASVALCVTLAAILAAFAVVSLVSGPRSFERIEREAPLPLVGKAPMEAVYAAIGPVARMLVALGVSANAITVASLVFAACAAASFGFGHFGLGTAFGAVAAMADALDGLVARQTGTASRFGQVLDTMIDRYVEALFIGGIAVFVRNDWILLSLALAALVGGYMVSYASSVLRELQVPDVRAPMRRIERLTCLLVATLLVPLIASAQVALSALPVRVELAPVVVALALIAVVGNVSAIRRLMRGARIAAKTAKSGDAQPISSPIPSSQVPVCQAIEAPSHASSKRLRHP